jgi:hypothetical protein
MEAILRLGRWIADGRHCHAQEERRRTLFAVLLIHFFFICIFWLITEALFGADVADDEEESSEQVHLLHPYQLQYHSLQVANYHLSNLLHLHHLRHFSMLVLNSLVAASLLVMLAKQAPLHRVMGLWVAYIYAHAFYFGLYRPHLGTEKWYLPVLYLFIYSHFVFIFIFIYLFLNSFYIKID